MNFHKMCLVQEIKYKEEKRTNYTLFFFSSKYNFIYYIFVKNAQYLIKMLKKSKKKYN